MQELCQSRGIPLIAYGTLVSTGRRPHTPKQLVHSTHANMHTCTKTYACTHTRAHTHAHAHTKSMPGVAQAGGFLAERFARMPAKKAVLDTMSKTKWAAFGLGVWC